MSDAAPLTPAEIAALQVEVQALRTKVEQYELLLDNTSDLLALATPREEFIYLSSAITRIAGYTREEYASRSLYEYIHPDDLPRILEETARARDAMPEVVVIVGRVRTKAGEYRWMENRTRIIHDGDGGMKYLVMVSRDLTERVELEQALRERTEELARVNAELARAARMKDEFLAGMSHELRTPLTAILGLAEALRLSIGGTLTDEQFGMVEDIEHSGRLLLELINDLLDLAKIEAGCMTLEPSLLDVEEVCVGALRMLSEAMRAVNPLGRLSRGVAGTRGRALILNVAGSPGAAVEMLDAVLDIVPHALRLMSGRPAAHPSTITPH